MGQDYPRWIMRELLRQLLRCPHYHLHSRFWSRSNACAGPLGSENEAKEKVGDYVDVRARTSVSNIFRASQFLTPFRSIVAHRRTDVLALNVISIGVFDLIRIAWRNKVASPDITYEYALLFCFSVLEGQLGIVLACVPVMQPALRKLTNKADLVALGSVFSGKINSRASSNPLPKSNTSGNLGRRLQRLDSFDPDINTTRTLGQGQDIEMGEGNTDAADRIQVTRTWGIQH